jgi:hypothetical protein
MVVDVRKQLHASITFNCLRIDFFPSLFNSICKLAIVLTFKINRFACVRIALKLEKFYIMESRVSFLMKAFLHILNP